MRHWTKHDKVQHYGTERARDWASELEDPIERAVAFARIANSDEGTQGDASTAQEAIGQIQDRDLAREATFILQGCDPA